MSVRFCHRGPGIFMLAGLVLVSPAARLCAAPNGLTQVPIAKVFGDGVADFSVERAVQDSQTTIYTTQYGISNQLEVGLDYQDAPSDQKAVLGNVKYLLAHRPGRLPDVAVGLVNIATRQKAVPYIVATTQPRATGLTLGLIRSSSGGGGYYGMVGVDYDITPTIQIAGDYIAGKSSYGTLGVIAALTKTVTLDVAYAQPNTAGNADDGFNPRGYIVNLAYTFHLKGGAKAGEDTGSHNKKPAATAGGSG